MRELFVGTRTVSDQDGQPHCFEYYVLIGQMEVGGHFACESYGVKIREPGVGTTSIPDLTVSTERIDALIELLIRNTVGPSSVRDVVEDWL